MKKIYMSIVVNGRGELATKFQNVYPTLAAKALVEDWVLVSIIVAIAAAETICMRVYIINNGAAAVTRYCTVLV
eukprot:scaffold1719_cov83-Skeletonema_dohrnii-CCMP3373.AAC.2